MVLQEINDGGPPRDNDFQSTFDGPSSTSSSGVASQPIINVKDLPRPPPLFGALLGYSDTFLTDRLNKSIAAASQVVGRPLSQQETDAVSYHLAAMSRTAAWGDVIGLGGGFLRWRATREEGRFPFWRRIPEIPETWGPFKGNQVKLLFQSMRFVLYTGVGWAVGGLFAGSYAALTYTVKMSQDSRLQELTEAIKKRNENRNGGLPEAQQARRAMPMPRSQQSQVYSSSNDDDMSPQSGSYTDTGLLSDNQMAARDRMQRADPRQSSTADRENTFSMDKVTRQPRGFGDYDDASPSAGNFENGDTQKQSAWDRIRQRGVNGSNESGGAPRSFEERSRARGAQSAQDSFSFSNSDEAKQLAQSEAQRDFDARVQRERQGGDFEQTGRR